MNIQHKAYIIGGIISSIAGFDYFLDIRYISEFHTKSHKDSNKKLVISRRLHKICLDELKNKNVVMINPLTQQYLISEVEKVAYDEITLENQNQIFQMRMPQGTFYAKINSEQQKGIIDFTYVHSVSQIQAVPMIIID